MPWAWPVGSGRWQKRQAARERRHGTVRGVVEDLGHLALPSPLTLHAQANATSRARPRRKSPRSAVTRGRWQRARPPRRARAPCLLPLLSLPGQACGAFCIPASHPYTVLLPSPHNKTQHSSVADASPACCRVVRLARSGAVRVNAECGRQFAPCGHSAFAICSHLCPLVACAGRMDPGGPVVLRCALQRAPDQLLHGSCCRGRAHRLAQHRVACRAPRESTAVKPGLHTQGSTRSAARRQGSQGSHAPCFAASVRVWVHTVVDIPPLPARVRRPHAICVPCPPPLWTPLRRRPPPTQQAQTRVAGVHRRQQRRDTTRCACLSPSAPGGDRSPPLRPYVPPCTPSP